MTKKIDLNFRPKSYFEPQTLEQHLVSKVKGAVVREKLEMFLKEGSTAEIVQLLRNEGISNEDIKALGSIHPMLMAAIIYQTQAIAKSKLRALKSHPQHSM